MCIADYCYFFIVPLVLEHFGKHLRGAYKTMRKKPQREEWPPYQPTSIVNVTVIHYKSRQTQQQLIKISEHLKTGSSGISKLESSPPLDSAVTKDISEIFKADPADQTEANTKSEPPKLILIEGAPGIGKTVLAKEIAYLWADNKLLTDCKMLILVYLRNPEVHTMKSIEELLQLYITEKVASEVNAYLERSKGKNMAFVFDGFDEFPTSQQNSIITDILGTSSDYIRKFCESTVVVTSRPTATLFLHEVVDRRIEILGYDPEERNKIISQFPDQTAKLEKYFAHNPIISSVCYIPLNLAIILYLFHQGSLPKTLTEMNESFIVHTVYRHMAKSSSPLTGNIKCLKDLPKNVVKIIHKIASLAFIGLLINRLVFTYNELMDVCPEIHDIPEAANAFSLLQVVQHYPKKGAGTTTTYNFLHLTLQEYLAAYYVSTLSEQVQLELLQKTFWEDCFNFMWMMYVGTVGVKSVVFDSFVGMMNMEQRKVVSKRESYTIQRDKLKCLHLFQCYMEGGSNTEMPQAISSIFADGDINLDGVTLLSHNITSLLHFMSTSSQQWKSLVLRHCNLQRTEMNNLMQNIMNIKQITSVEYVDLSANYASSPWGVYSAIIRHCCVTSLTLCGDQGMDEYLKEITDSLQANTSLKSLVLFGITKNGIESIKELLMKNLSLKRLYLIWRKETYISSNQVILENALFLCIANTMGSYAKENNNINICVLLDSDDNLGSDCYLKSINLYRRCNKDLVHVLAFGLRYNTTVEELNISHCNIKDEESIAIFDCLEHNKTLKKLDLSCNSISVNGLKKILENIENQGTTLLLQYVNLRKNYSSPWGVYCAIIRHCCVNSLTLCGDKGMNKYIKDIQDSLEMNPGLHKLTLLNMGKTGVESIKAVLMTNCSITTLNFALKNAEVENIKYRDYDEQQTYYLREKLEAEYIILMHAYFLSNAHNAMKSPTKISNTNRVVDVSILYEDFMNDYSCSPYSSDIVDTQNDGIKTSAIIILSHKRINDDGVHVLAFGLCNNTTIVELNISYNDIGDDGAIAIIGCLVHNRTLKKLDLSRNKISTNGMNKISENIENQRVGLLLEYINLRENDSSPWGVYCAIIRHCCVNSLTLCGDDGLKEFLKEIMDSLKANKTLWSFTLQNFGKNGVELIKVALTNNLTSKRLVFFLLWQRVLSDTASEIQNKGVVHTNDRVAVTSYSTIISLFPSFGTITLSFNWINGFVHVLASGLCKNTTTVEELNLSYNQITDKGAIAILNCLKYNKTLTKINLEGNRISSSGMNKMVEYIGNQVTSLPLEYIDLSGNKSLLDPCDYIYTPTISPPWGVYCEFIRHCCISHLTLCGDEGMNEYIEEMTDSLQSNATLQSLTLLNVGKIGVNSLKAAIINSFTLKIQIYSSISYSNKGFAIQIKATLLNNTSHVGYTIGYNVSYNSKLISLCDDEVSNESKSINLCSISICSDLLYVLSLGLCNDTTKEELDISHSGINDEGAIAIIDCLKHNKMLKRLVLSHNNIGVDGMNEMLENIENERTQISLEYVDLSENQSSPWGMYCAIIRHCCVNSLTLCGDQGINTHIEDMIHSLEINITLHTLTLCKIGKTDLKLFENALHFSQMRSKYSKKLIFSKMLFDSIVVISKEFCDECVYKNIDLSNFNIKNEGCEEVLCYMKCSSTTIEKLNISHSNITDIEVVAICEGLKFNEILKELDLSHNTISIDGMNRILETIENRRTSLSLEYVDLSENDSSPWGVYCAIIRHCCVNSLTLCGGEGMKEYVEKITESLQANQILLTLTLCSIGRIGVESINAVVVNKIALKVLNLSWKKIKSTKTFVENVLIHTHLNDSTRYSMLYCNGDVITKYTSIFSNEHLRLQINNDTIHLLGFALCYFKELEELSIPYNKITDEGTVAITECLKYNKMLKRLDLSNNGICSNGMIKMSEVIKNQATTLLEYVDLSENDSSPWGVYCAVIRHCYVNGLTLCGDEGMNEYIEEITDSLQANTTLQSLTLFSIRKNGMKSIKTILMNNLTLKKLNLSWESCIDFNSTCSCQESILLHNLSFLSDGDKKQVDRDIDVCILYNNFINPSVHCSSLCKTSCTENCLRKSTILINLSGVCFRNGDDDVGHILAFSLCCNTTVVELNISHNNVTDEGAIAIIGCLEYNKTLKKLDLSRNSISINGMNKIMENIENRAFSLSLEFIDLSENRSSPWGVYCAIIRHCCVNSLTLCGDEEISKYFYETITDCGDDEYIGEITDYEDEVIDECTEDLEITDSEDEGMNECNEKITNSIMNEYIEQILDGLQGNITLQLVTLCNLEPGVKLLKDINLLQNKARQMSFCILSVDHNPYRSTYRDKYTVVISSNKYYDQCLPKTFNLSKFNMNDKDITDFLNCNAMIQKLNISDNNISDSGVVAICRYLEHSETLKEVDLSQNKITINGMDWMIETYEHQETMLSLEYIDLSGNNSSPWGVYCAIIRHCYVNSLTLCGDEGMYQFSEEIIHVLKTNTTLESLTLCSIGKCGIEIIKAILKKNMTLKELNLSWKKINRRNILIKTSFSPNSDKIQAKTLLNDVDGVVNVSILYDDYVTSGLPLPLFSDVACNQNYGSLTNVINFSYARINDDAAHVLAFGLCNNTTIVELIISHNKIGDDGAIAIIDSLKHNKTLRKLDLSYNHIRPEGMNKMLVSIKKQETILLLEYIDLSCNFGNFSSPWDLYCVIIGHCHANSLTLCGNNGMEKYSERILDSLQTNPKLLNLSLTLIHGYNEVKEFKYYLQVYNQLQIKARNNCKKLFYVSFHDNEPKDFTISCTIIINSIVFYNDHSPTNVNLSNLHIDNNDVVHFMINHSITKTEKLDVSRNEITDEGVVVICDCLPHIEMLKELNLSQNKIGNNGMNKILESLKQAKLSLEYVDLSENSVSPWGVYCHIIKHCCVNSLSLCGDEGIKEYIKQLSDGLQVNTTLHSLTLYGIGKIGIEAIKEILMYKFTLRKLNLVWENIKRKDMENFLLDNYSYYRDHCNVFHIKVMVSNNPKNVAKVSILCDYDVSHSQSPYTSIDHVCTHNRTSETVIDLSGQRINDDAVHVLVFGLYNNTTVEELNISHNRITNDGALAIFDCLKQNKALKKLNLSQNSIDNNGMNKILKSIENQETPLSLEYVNVSKNKSSPWGVYCAIIRHCCFNSLTLCGSKGMKEYFKKIIETLQTNTTLQSITLNDIEDSELQVFENTISSFNKSQIRKKREIENDDKVKCFSLTSFYDKKFKWITVIIDVL